MSSVLPSRPRAGRRAALPWLFAARTLLGLAQGMGGLAGFLAHRADPVLSESVAVKVVPGGPTAASEYADAANDRATTGG